MKKITKSDGAPFRIVLYPRVSTREQLKGGGLDRQYKKFEWFMDIHDCEIVKVFEEQGESAKTANRPKLQELIKYSTNKANRVDIVLIEDDDRLARNALDALTIRKKLLAADVMVVSATNPVLEDNEDSVAWFGMKAVLSELDNAKRSKRTRGGQDTALTRKRYPWMAVVGYVNSFKAGIVSDQKLSNLVQDQIMAPIMRRAFERLATGRHSGEDLRRMAIKEGLEKKSGGPPNRSYFYKLLRNPLYKGYTFKRDKWWKLDIEPIVSEELFDRAQQVLGRAKTLKAVQALVYVRDRPDFPLRRFVKHPTGASISGSWSRGKMGKRYAYYHYLKVKEASFPRIWFEGEFATYMDSFRFNEANLQRLEELMRAELTSFKKSDGHELVRIQSQIKTIESRKDDIVVKSLDGVFDDAVTKSQLAKCDAELAELRAGLVEHKPVGIDVEKAIALARDYLLSPSAVWRSSDLETQLKLQKFQFPQNVSFDGTEFGTLQVASVFNVKNRFSNLASILSSSVDPRGLEPPASSVQMRRSTR